jgi:endoglucanase
VAIVAAALLPAAGIVVRPATAAGSTGWTSSGNAITTPGGARFVISGINWYGFETTSFVAHGLYSQDYTTIVNEAKSYGYNTIRIPFSSQMWEQDPIPSRSRISACPSCHGQHSRDILALIVNYAGSLGLHVILDNHRSEAGNSAEANGLWYVASGNTNYPESHWISDWTSIEDWSHGTLFGSDHVAVNAAASDGYPVVLGFDLRNEPHTPSRTSYLNGATWGSGDGVSPSSNPNPNPFSPTCVSTSTCHDWRLAAERAGDSILGEAASKGWAYPLVFVEGVSQYPTASGTMASGPYDYYWWGGELAGVNGNAANPGAPVVLNAGGSSTALGASVAGQLVYSAHDYGPSEYQSSWFNTSTCYAHGCSASSLADLWVHEWAYINAGGVAPAFGGAAYPWGSATAYTSAPVWIGEFGTGDTSADLYTSGAGSQGQWFTDLVNFLQSSYTTTTTNNPGLPAPVHNINWTYWALNGEDAYGLLTSSYSGLASSPKEYSFLCAGQQGPLAVTSAGGCGSTGSLPAPN